MELARTRSKQKLATEYIKVRASLWRFQGSRKGGVMNPRITRSEQMNIAYVPVLTQRTQAPCELEMSNLCSTQYMKERD